MVNFGKVGVIFNSDRYFREDRLLRLDKVWYSIGYYIVFNCNLYIEVLKGILVKLLISIEKVIVNRILVVILI